VNGNDDNLRSLRARRVAAEQDHRDEELPKFDVRQAARSRVVDLDDPSGERVALEAKLAEWTAANPELAGEIAAFERTTA